MPRQTLTNEFIEGLRGARAATRLVMHFDTEIPGFLLEHRATGGATYYFRYRDAGGRIRLSRLGRMQDLPLAEARARAYRMHEILKEGGDPREQERDAPRRMTLNAFVTDRYLPFARATKRSWRTDECLIRRHILPRFGEEYIGRIRRADVTDWHVKLREQGYKPATANLALVMLRIMFNSAIRWELLPQGANPTRDVKLFEANNQRQRYLSNEEMVRLLAELDTNRNRQACTAIKLLLLTGARKSEVLHAKWEDVDLVQRLLRVPLSKSGKYRFIPLSEHAVALIRGIARDPDSAYLFITPKTGRAPNSLFRCWQTIRENAGLADLRIHDLRHSFASFLINNGRSLYEVQRILGHADTKTTMRYAHLSQSSLLDAANVVGQVIEAAAKPPSATPPPRRLSGRAGTPRSRAPAA